MRILYEKSVAEQMSEMINSIPKYKRDRVKGIVLTPDEMSAYRRDVERNLQEPVGTIISYNGVRILEEDEV